MNQIIRRIASLSVMWFALAACSHAPPAGKGPMGSAPPVTGPVGSTKTPETFSPCVCEPGNTTNHYSTHGCFAEKDGWVYFVDRSKGGLLSRKRTDDSDLMDYNEKPVSSINVVDDWIYYQKRSHLEESYIYRMRTDGSIIEKISPTLSDYNSCANFIVRGEFIYFSNFEDNSSLYRMKTDGSEMTKLNDAISYSLNMDGDWIYYVRMNKTAGEGNELHRIRPDGTEDVLLTTGTCTTILPYKDWVYFVGAESGKKPLYRIRSDGTDQMTVVRDNICGINIHDDRLYYVTQGDGRLWTSAPDGSEARQLMEERAFGIQIAGGWLYFSNVDESNRPYRIRLDGSGLEKAYAVQPLASDPEESSATGIGVDNANPISRFVRAGDWIYFSLDSYQGEIRKMFRNGISHSTVIKVPGSDLNAVGHWLYFIDSSLYDTLARVRVDGTGYGTILDQSASELIVRDEWMYFINGSDKNRIYRVKTDGTSLTMLRDQAARSLQMDGEWLFFEPSLELDSQGEEGVFKIKLDGSQHKKVTGEAISRMTVAGGWIYYTTETDDRLRRMKTDGSGDETLSDEQGILYGVYDDWIYWYSTADEKGMFRMDLEGNQKTSILGPGNYALVHFLEDKIVYFDNDTGKYQLMELDGSARREVNP